MIVVLEKGYTQEQLQGVIDEIRSIGCREHVVEGVEKTVIALVGQPKGFDRDLEMEKFMQFPGVTAVVPISRPYKLVSTETHPSKTIISFDNGISIGGDEIVMMAGPCSVENEAQILRIAQEVKDAGAHFLRGGAYKPRTSPYSFQGLEEEGLRLLAKAREETGLKVITEVISVETVGLVAEYADILQVGARNMQNYALLKELGRCGRPVLLKRGLSALIDEWLMCAEYIISHGNKEVILCERGIRTYEKLTRNTLDLNAVPVVKGLTHLPIIVDPSHGAGKSNLIAPMSNAGIACGADGLIIEVHYDPPNSYSDPQQAITAETFAEIVRQTGQIAQVIGRKVY